MKEDNHKTLYLWDLANTLFPEKWNSEISGFPNHQAYAKSIGLDPQKPRDYEMAVKEPYLHGDWYTLGIADGYEKVLSWTKHNEAFTTGLREQMDWRAQYLNPKVGFDIRSYLQKITSTFDYAETNIKTKEMLVDFLRSKYDSGYQSVVYTDDNLKNCQLFKEASETVKLENPAFNFRLYHLLNGEKGVKAMGWYIQIGGLPDLLENEKILSS